MAIKYPAEFAMLASVIQMDLLSFCRNDYAAILCDLNVDYIWITAHRTVFHILLISSRR